MRPLIALLVFLTCTTAFAGGTSYWTHTTEADFKEGKFEQTVATNLGDLKLSRAVKELLPLDPRVSAINSLASLPDGTIYAGTGPQGVLLRIKDGKVTDECVLSDSTAISSLVVDGKGRLIVGTIGEKGKIYRIDKPGAKPVEIFTHDDVQYIWSMVESSDGTLYAATGPEGQVFSIKPDGKSTVLFDSDENNIVSLATDGKDLLFAGTDPNGLVYRINRNTGEAFVMYDAAETEISSLVFDSRGHLLAASGQSIEGIGMDGETADPAGRPEGAAPAEPIPGQAPVEPEPPKVPLPTPGEPKPIPKATTKGVSSHTPANGVHQFVAFRAHSNRSTLIPSLSRSEREANPGRASFSFFLPLTPGAGWDDRLPRLNTPAKQQSALFTLHGPLEDTLGAGPTTEPQIIPPPGMGLDSVNSASTGSDNAVYDIAPDGIVTEIFRQPVTIFAIAEHAGSVLIATGGDEGKVWQISPTADESVVLATVESKEMTALLPLKDGGIILGLANTGQVIQMSPGLAETGTFTSVALDAEHISRFGKLHLRGTLPDGTKLTVSTRTGNVSDPSFAGWSDWSPETPAAEYLAITSPSARFLQYRLTFHSAAGKDSPVVDEIKLAYQAPNLAPKVTSVTATPLVDTTDPGKRVITVTWSAKDPNEDACRYTLAYRASRQGAWIDLKTDIAEETFEWNTRTVPDGVYQLRVTASDTRANPVGEGKSASRVSEAVVVDNTPPVLGNIKQPKPARVELTVADRSGTVKSLEFSINSSDDWQTVPPSDMIADSPEEAYAFDVSSNGAALKPGTYQVSLRATDSAGNQSFESVTFTVPESK